MVFFSVWRAMSLTVKIKQFQAGKTKGEKIAKIDFRGMLLHDFNLPSLKKVTVRGTDSISSTFGQKYILYGLLESPD